MTKKQEYTKLKEAIEISEIHESTRRLKELLEGYKKSEQVRSNVYSIQLEFIKVHQKIENLLQHLEDVIEMSESWEEK